MVRRNAELAALTDLADAVTRMRGERPLVERGLQVLLHVSDARSVHIELGGEHHQLPPGATLPDGDPFAVGMPLVVRDQQLGSVMLVGRDEPFAAETLRLVGVLGDQLAVGLSHIRDYTEKSHQALRDPLTGIYNRRVLQDALARELLRARRDDGELALTMLDIDDFKGDQRRPRSRRRRRGAAARRRVRARRGAPGGHVRAHRRRGVRAAHARRRRRRRRCSSPSACASPWQRSTCCPTAGVTVSAGLAAYPADAPDGDTLRRAADEALYRAKAAGKNRCELAGEASAPA